ncbi:hypothetical protein ACFQL8_26795 [Streptomyces goshikiensis]|uniref:hypothetical protein n=1 Tax=Streptomyces goshikiensis TaxID=1942 RepID=UPI0016755EB3|nr:hypothetical protein [Streptomyces goshikiensis]GHD76256.1 hypothetical protein GCM10010336_53720 [Streptomyces goshikiensis]
MVGSNASEQVASPYATGGGGTVLEHGFGAVLLTHLLLGDPVPALGDDVTPVSVRFQDSSFSPVDDLIVVGNTADGTQRRLSIGVRRAPVFTTSDVSTADLLVSYLRIVTDHWAEAAAGRWRLALAVASTSPAVRQVLELAVIARGQPDEESFRAVMMQPGRTTEAVRSRLSHLDALIAQAATSSKVSTERPAAELTWRVLHVLWLWQLRLEGADESDRTAAVARLRSVVPDASVEGSATLFEALGKLSRSYAPTAATVTESMLRRQLSGTAVVHRSPSYAPAWRALDALSETAENLVRFRLTSVGENLELERAEAGNALASEARAVASRATALIVHGEPDAGKSALALRTAGRLRADGVAVTVLNLREIPATLAEFEALLGARLAAVLSASAVGTGRLLVVDGAESVLEGRAQLLSDLARAAMAAGLGVVAVTRADGSGAAREVLVQAAESVTRDGGTGEDLVREHEVPQLTSAEITRLVEVFPQLGQWAGDQRTRWLLGRPGLVDMLLRAGPGVAAPQGAASEADLFAAVWRNLVRRGEVMRVGGPSPDARDQSLQALARRQLLPRETAVPPDPTALPSLRSDGLLAALGPTSAWSPSDRFASDLVRDMAVVRLLVTDGFALLSTADAPRWALRAARVACQAHLLGADDGERSLAHLRTVFDGIAADHGERWSDVPWEAVLTLGAAGTVLGRVWPALQTDQQAGLRTVIRLAMQRYASHGVGDPLVLAPLVELAFCHPHDAGSDSGSQTTYEVGHSVRELVLAWLYGLVKAETRGPVPIRQSLRDRVLASDPEHSDEFAVEALAMLGPDLDGRTEAFLRGIANNRSSRLEPAVESFWAATEMARHQPDLLLALAESYYIEQHDPEKARYDWSRSHPFDDGIRHHRARGGLAERLTGWYRGPFWPLLKEHAVPALALINRMLDHAATVQVGNHGDDVRAPADEPTGVELELAGVVRHCIGDGQVWAWYRGSSVGPYPCVSALLAVERMADQLVAIAGIPPARVVDLLLRDCNNLAMPGLVVGFLTRHLEQASDLLIPWMRDPNVWQLEFARVDGEGVLHVQGPDEPDLVGQSRRRSSPRDIAAELTMRAFLSGDQGRLDELAATGEELVRRAEEVVAGSQDAAETDRFLTSVQGWAATFRPENFHLETDGSGNLTAQYQHPEPLATHMRPELEMLDRVSQALRLQNAYAGSDSRTAPPDTLLVDIALARSLGDDTPDLPIDRLDPIAAVAATASVAQARGRIQVPVDDLRWATTVLIKAITEPHRIEYVSSSFNSMGADRSAATGLAALLAVPSDDAILDRQAVIDALTRCSTHHFDEVRMAFATALEHVWAAPCDTGQPPGPCRHQAALDAVEAGLQDCRLGDWDPETGTRERPQLYGPYEQSLPAVETEQLYLISLIPPLVAAGSASLSDSCVAERASGLTAVLLAAHARSTDHWAKEGYKNRHSRRSARLIVDLAVSGATEPLKAHAWHFATNSRALHEFLRDLTVLFTYDDGLRTSLPTVWPVVMEAALDAIGDSTGLRTSHHWDGRALGSLLPTPEIDMSDIDIDATLARAREDWLHPDILTGLLDRWTVLARQEPEALDALARLGKCAPLVWQRDTGLRLAERLIDGDHRIAANRCWYLPDWLGALHSRDAMTPDQIARWRRLVDGLASAGDHRAADLQRMEE